MSTTTRRDMRDYTTALATATEITATLEALRYDFQPDADLVPRLAYADWFWEIAAPTTDRVVFVNLHHDDEQTWIGIDVREDYEPQPQYGEIHYSNPTAAIAVGMIAEAVTLVNHDLPLEPLPTLN